MSEKENIKTEDSNAENAEKKDCIITRLTKNHTSFCIYVIILLILFFTISSITLYLYTTETAELTAEFYQSSITLLEEVQSSTSEASPQTSDLKDEQKNNHDEFMASYYKAQSDWLNRWLTVLGILLTFIGIMTPLLFMRYYSEKKEDFEKLEQKMHYAHKKMDRKYNEMGKTHDEMKRTVLDSQELKSQIEKIIGEQYSKIEKDMIAVKEYVDETKVNKYLSEASIQYAQKNYDNAIELYEKTLEIDNNNSDALHYIGVCYHYKKDSATALKYYSKALKIDSQNHILLSNIGMIYQDSKNYEKAIEYYFDALDVAPQSANILLDLGNCFYNTKKYDKAIEYYLKSLQLEPKNSFALMRVGLCHNMKEEYEHAFDYYNQALKISPNNSDILINLGLCYYNVNDYNKAIENYLKSLSIRKDDVALYNIVEAYIFTHDFENAFKYLQEFLTMDNYIIDDDKPKWLKVLDEHIENEHVPKIIELVETLKVKPRDNE